MKFSINSVKDAHLAYNQCAQPLIVVTVKLQII